MDACPKCERFSLEYDPESKVARCLAPQCGFRKPAASKTAYYKTYAPAEVDLIGKLATSGSRQGTA